MATGNEVPNGNNGSNGSGNMGLSGLPRNVGNLTAMAVLAACFVWLLYRWDQQAHEDRQLARQQLADIRVVLQQVHDQLDGLKGQLDRRSP